MCVLFCVFKCCYRCVVVFCVCWSGVTGCGGSLCWSGVPDSILCVEVVLQVCGGVLCVEVVLHLCVVFCVEVVLQVCGGVLKWCYKYVVVLCVFKWCYRCVIVFCVLKWCYRFVVLLFRCWKGMTDCVVMSVEVVLHKCVVVFRVEVMYWV